MTKKQTKMYNEERKMKFLDENMDSNHARSILKKLTPYEEKEKMDLCEFPLEILQKAVDSEFGVKNNSFRVIIYVLRNYVEWCGRQGCTVSDAVYKIKNNSAKKMKEQMIPSPSYLASLLNRIFDPVALGTADCLMHCFVWMAYSGIDAEDAANVTIDDIDFDNMLIRCGGDHYELYGNAVPAFKAACNADKFRYIHPHYPDKVIYMDRKPGNNLMRSIKTEKMSESSLSGKLSQYSKRAGIKITYEKTQLSGMFYRMHEQELLGWKIDFHNLAVEMEKKRESNCTAESTRINILHNAKHLKKDYESWKIAFSYAPSETGGATDTPKLN